MAILFFFLSKTLGVLLLPSSIIITIGVLGLVLLPTRLVSAGRRLLTTCVLLLIVCSSTPLPLFFFVPLETRFPHWTGAGTEPRGIIVLGGAIDPVLSKAHGVPVLNSSVDRIVAAARLARQYPNAQIVFSGGSGQMFSDAREADWSERAFETMGVPRDRILFERNARSTYENAIFTKALVNPQPTDKWILVTSAFHMARAVGVFRASGFDVDAYPTDWKTLGTESLYNFPGYNLGGLGLLDLAIKEWLGLVAYRLTGRSAELFPSPVASH